MAKSELETKEFNETIKDIPEEEKNEEEDEEQDSDKDNLNESQSDTSEEFEEFLKGKKYYKLKNTLTPKMMIHLMRLRTKTFRLEKKQIGFQL
jgi:hypothetical protein